MQQGEGGAVRDCSVSMNRDISRDHRFCVTDLVVSRKRFGADDRIYVVREVKWNNNTLRQSIRIEDSEGCQAWNSADECISNRQAMQLRDKLGKIKVGTSVRFRLCPNKYPDVVWNVISIWALNDVEFGKIQVNLIESNGTGMAQADFTELEVLSDYELNKSTSPLYLKYNNAGEVIEGELYYTFSIDGSPGMTYVQQMTEGASFVPFQSPWYIKVTDYFKVGDRVYDITNSTQRKTIDEVSEQNGKVVLYTSYVGVGGSCTVRDCMNAKNARKLPIAEAKTDFKVDDRVWLKEQVNNYCFNHNEHEAPPVFVVQGLGMQKLGCKYEHNGWAFNKRNPEEYVKIPDIPNEVGQVVVKKSDLALNGALNCKRWRVLDIDGNYMFISSIDSSCVKDDYPQRVLARFYTIIAPSTNPSISFAQPLTDLDVGDKVWCIFPTLSNIQRATRYCVVSVKPATHHTNRRLVCVPASPTKWTPADEITFEENWFVRDHQHKQQNAEKDTNMENCCDEWRDALQQELSEIHSDHDTKITDAARDRRTDAARVAGIVKLGGTTTTSLEDLTKLGTTYMTSITTKEAELKAVLSKSYKKANRKAMALTEEKRGELVQIIEDFENLDVSWKD